MRGVDEYQSINNETSLDDFIKEYRPIVFKIAKYYKRKVPSNIEIDGVDFTYSGTAGEANKFNNNTELKALIEANTTLNAKYDVAIDGSNIKLTQKTASSTAATGDVTEVTAGATGRTVAKSKHLFVRRAGTRRLRTNQQLYTWLLELG